MLINDDVLENIIPNLIDFTNLNFLSFSFNEIHKIDILSIILSLKSIKILDFSHNLLISINKKKTLDSNINKNLPGKLEFLDISFNFLNNFNEILKIMKIRLGNSNAALLDNFFCLSIKGNPFNSKFIKYFNSKKINLLNFVFNKIYFEENFIKKLNIITSNNNKTIKIGSSKNRENENNFFYYYVDFLNTFKTQNYIKSGSFFKNFIKELSLLIEEENFEKLKETKENNFVHNKNEKEFKPTESLKLKNNNYLKTENKSEKNSSIVNNSNNNYVYDIENSILECSIIEELKQFNLSYENYSFTARFKNYNDKNIFLEKVNKENSLKVLVLSKRKLNFIPKILISDKAKEDTNSININNFNNNELESISYHSNINFYRNKNKEISIIDTKVKECVLSPSNLNSINIDFSRKVSESGNNNINLSNPKYLALNSIKILYLNFNKISSLNNLDQFQELSELYVQSNKIRNLPYFEMKFLKKLDLSNNHIQTLDGISNMKNLTNILLENNKISSLSLTELVLLTQLKEFNISGNHIESLKECISLKRIESIQNLDLSGNEVSNYVDFRIFIIYYLNNLKILNRFPVEKNELLQAREFFDGRITSELLESKLGHTQTKNVRELDLSNNKLKSFEKIFNSDNFPNLRKHDYSKNSRFGMVF